ncbi:hypothetical protein R3W88_021087 [Solanum pinnatisectum]|uniref:KIB1-4 beta-propeller domain-containing protein n=1 Tax=Solanum pinnatisectum TaxID=50273 RepID=A0AAV9LST5_9SOLN|nr:hypothetical protein R3W88_021087 [Solanum pinnatisectum]
MLAEKEGNEENREFFDLTKGITYTMNFPQLVGKRCLGVGIRYYVQKAMISSDPHTTDDDYILMINQGVPRTLAYWKPGKNAFITVETRKATYSDVTWHDGQFYGVDVRGNVVILDFGGGLEPTIGRIYSELFVITRDGICNHPETKTYGVEEFVVCKVDVDNDERSGKDMGIYNDTIESHYTGESYHRFSPPIWIFNTPFSA